MAMTWRGMLAPLGTKDGAGRSVPIHNIDTDIRPLPLPLRVQQGDWGGHQGATSIGTIDKVWIDGPQLWGSGRFDEEDDTAKKTFSRIKRKFARHISVDLDPGTGKLMGATIVDCPAFENAEIMSITSDDEADHAMSQFAVADTSDGHLEWGIIEQQFAATTGAQIGDRDRAWDSGAAAKRIATWADGDASKLAQAYMYRDPDKDPKTAAAYKLPYADIIDGTLTIIPKAVFAIAAVLQGSRGGVDIPAAAQKTIKTKIAALYSKMSKKFGDNLTVPWQDSTSTRSVEAAAAFAASAATYQKFLHNELAAGK